MKNERGISFIGLAQTITADQGTVFTGDQVKECLLKHMVFQFFTQHLTMLRLMDKPSLQIR